MKRLCAHADHNGDGMHWLAPGEACPLTNDIRTRHLIVTLPDVSGEEADTLVEDLDTMLSEHKVGEVATVAHALGEPLPADTVVRSNVARKGLVLLQHRHHRIDLTVKEARALAGALLAAADHAEDGAR